MQLLLGKFPQKPKRSNCIIIRILTDGDDVHPSLAKKTMTSNHWGVEWVRRWLKSPIFVWECLLQCGQGMLGAGPGWPSEHCPALRILTSVMAMAVFMQGSDGVS